MGTEVMKSIIQENTASPAVVVGLENFVAIQTVRVLAKRKIPVIGITNNPRLFCARTNMCEKILVTNTNNEELIETLISFGRKMNQKPALIPDTDICVRLIARNQEKLQPYYHISLPEAKIVNLLMNKASFYEYASKENLPIPKTFFLHSREHAELTASEISYPCIFKPALRTQKWLRNSKQKVYKVCNRNDFLDLYEQLSKWSDVLIAQEWIPGPDSNLYSCNCYFNDKHEPLATFISKKLRQWPQEIGVTSLGQECKCDEVLDITVRLFKKVKFQGLGYLEIKRDERSGKYYIIEPNIGRPTGRSALAEACGVELLYSMYCDMMGLPQPKHIEQKNLGIKWIHLGDDVLSAFKYWRHRDLSIKGWWKSLCGPKTFAVFNLSDPVPFLEEIRMMLISIIKDKIGKLLRLNRSSL